MKTPWRAAPILGVPDVHAAVAYYTDVLGFELRVPVIEGVAPGEGAVYAIVWREEVALHLQIRRGPVSDRKRESIESDVYLFIDDADALFAELESKGARILRGLEDEPYGLRDFTVEDPFGHRLVFGAPLS